MASGCMPKTPESLWMSLAITGSKLHLAVHRRCAPSCSGPHIQKQDVSKVPMHGNQSCSHPMLTKSMPLQCLPYALDSSQKLHLPHMMPIPARGLQVLIAELPTCSAYTCKGPPVLTVPPMASSPGRLFTGRDSPVSMDSSTCERPATTTPSAGMRAPGITCISAARYGDCVVQCKS